jgi:putative PEP-CTERM system histidine kinase
VSRSFVFYTATVVGAGLYLMTMAAAGYYVRRFGGSWSGFLQTVFLFGTALLLIVPLSSGSFRAYFRILVERSFFQYKYDYRTEWLRFIATMSSPEPGEDRRRPVIQAVGDLVESPDGGIWLRRESEQFNLAASWNMSRWQLVEAEAVIPIASPLVSFLESKQWVINLEELATHPDHYPGLAELPHWLLTAARPWLVLPLVHMERLYGVMILGRPRVSRQLAWEDFDLLKTVTRQAASYLAEQDTSEALAAARQFEAFNKRFAFVIHDIKNLASQLSLILSNAEKHRGNVQFQNDMIETVRQSVEKINRMLKQLHAEPERSAPRAAVELAALLSDIVATQKQLGPDISLELRANGLSVAADEDRLKAVVEQLVQNAVDAVGGKGRVQVRLAGEGKMAVIEVEDDGPGMDDEFVRDKLFHPFATTKGVGYGIGAYESRDFASSLGGRLEVTSQPGRGTIMRMRLPAIGLP